MLFLLSVTFWLSSAFKSTTGWNRKIAQDISPQWRKGSPAFHLSIDRSLLLPGVLVSLGNIVICLLQVFNPSKSHWPICFVKPLFFDNVNLSIKTSTNMLAAVLLPDHVWRAAFQTDISKCYNFVYVFLNKHFRSATISQTNVLVSPFSYPPYIPVPVLCIIWVKLTFYKGHNCLHL